MNACFYDPLPARFLVPDPQVAAPETSNGYIRYVYASDNTMMYVDLNGKEGGIPWDWYKYNPNSNGKPNNNLNPGSNSTGNSLYKPYSGPNYGNQGGYSGDYSGTGLGSTIIAIIQSIFSPHADQSRFRHTATYLVVIGCILLVRHSVSLFALDCC